MDQVRAILKTLWEHRFWVLSSVGTLVVLACWSMATSDLDAQFVKRKRAIESMFTAMNSLDAQQLHPNERVIGRNSEETEKEGVITLEKWTELYNYQSEKVLSWPTDHLEAQFIREINRLKFGDPFPASRAQDMRGNYWNYIEKRFDGLLEIVQALKIEDSKRGISARGGGEDFGRAPGGAVESEQEEYLVQWVDQGDLQTQLHFVEKPTALEIWVTQEDLWVYETLLKAIANTNKARGATRPGNTAVRIIYDLQVGRKAIEGGNLPGNILFPLTSGATGSSLGGYPGEGGFSGGGGRSYAGDGGFAGEGGFSGGPETGSADSAILESRYLDTATGRPLEGDLTTLGTEFRQLPIRMVLKMNQSWIPHVLVECANAALPVEVKKMRINPSQSGEGFGTGSTRAGDRRNVRGLEPVADEENLVEVEIEGAVYIYNEPDKSKLVVPSDEADELDSTASTATTFQR